MNPLLSEISAVVSDQGSDGWNLARVGRFTASEMWRLMTNPKTKQAQENGNLSETAMTYVQAKVAEVLTGQPKAESYAYPLVYGKELEPQAIEYFIKKTGFTYEPAMFVPFGDHAGGSPDGYINETDGLEVKCPFNSENMVDYLMLTDQYDLKRNHPNHYWQVMSNLLFTDKEKFHFVCYDPRMVHDNHKMVHIVVSPNPDDFTAITDKIAKAVKEKLSLLQTLLP
jgi:hypothetical protein